VYYERKDRPASILRREVTGYITTTSPLHVGDGEESKVGGRDCEKLFLEGQELTYATVATDAGGKPLIPGTGLKGVLRGWAAAHKLPAELVNAVFGWPPPNEEATPDEAEKIKGGIMTFHDAYLAGATEPTNPEYRMWSNTRHTALSPQVALNPKTRTAEEQLLYYIEYVPEGAQFEFRITTQGATSEQMGLLLYVLREAGKSQDLPARFGAGEANGWGRFSVEIKSLKQMDPSVWMKGEPKPWREALEPVTEAVESDWLAAAQAIAPHAPANNLRLKLTLNFEGAMLIADPSRRERSANSGNEPVGHAMIRKEDGSAYLPAQSVRGAFRAQASRIWETLGGNANARTYLDLFGRAGWRAAIEMEDFPLIGAEQGIVQDFVAVDRFTGGVAGSKKFNAHGLWRPRFSGEIVVRADRLEHAKAGEWVWLLLVYTLRDWMEADCALGFGASKGYGAFRAIVKVEGKTKIADMVRGILSRAPEVLSAKELESWETSLNKALAEKDAA
jgi:CRISPR/Cas system CSM-associated protein Csm3 (group 7 of RAMP superfamily)